MNLQEEEMFAKNIMSKVRQSNRRNKVLLSVLQYDWPTTEHAIQKMGGYIAKKFNTTPGESESIAYDAVRFALADYSDALHSKDQLKLDDPLRYSVFIDALITKVYGAVENTDEEVERKHLYELITTSTIRDLLKKVGYEQAIIAGCLSVND